VTSHGHVDIARFRRRSFDDVIATSGDVVLDLRAVRINYFKSWFFVDLLSCLPYDIFNALQQANSDEEVWLHHLALYSLVNVSVFQRRRGFNKLGAGIFLFFDRLLQISDNN